VNTTSFENEENLLSLISLTEQDIIVEQTETLELWDHINKEILRLVLEESNAFDDLTMS